MDYSKYHPDWKDIIRPAILKRDAYKCRHCGTRHKSTVYKDSSGKYVECDDFIKAWALVNGYKPFVVYLAVAHVNHMKDDNRYENLMSLCPKCHGVYDKEHKRFIKKLYIPGQKAINEKDVVICSKMEDLLKKGMIERIKYLTDILIQREQHKNLLRKLEEQYFNDINGK